MQPLTPRVEPVEAYANYATPDVEGETTGTTTSSVDPTSCQAHLETFPARLMVGTDVTEAIADPIQFAPTLVLSAQDLISLRRFRTSLTADRDSLTTDRMSLAGIGRTLVSDRTSLVPDRILPVPDRGSLVEFYASLTRKLHGQGRPPVR